MAIAHYSKLDIETASKANKTMKLNTNISINGLRRTRSLLLATVVLAVLAAVSPVTVFAASPHLKESAPVLIDKTLRLYGSMVASAALLHDYDPKLILAVIVVESEGNARAVSYRGAEGLMQLMPRTARAMGVKDAKEPFQNILAGTRYLRELEDNYGFDSPQEALVAYNMGPTRAKRFLARAASSEYGYVSNVMYVYDLIDKDEFAPISARGGDQTRQAERGTTNFPQLEALFTRPRSLSLVTFPTNISSNRKIEVESEN
jgi:soluble lytic murein transglycosylase-like protein